MATIISGYTKDNKLVEGTLFENSKGVKLVLHENGVDLVSSLKCVRLIEEEETEVDKQVNADINVIKKDLETKKPSQEDLEKAGEDRAKELSDAGMKEKTPDEYKTKFVVQASAVVGGADAGIDQDKADAKNSEALKGLTESEVLHPDYQVAEPYDDDLTRDQIYLKMKKEIDNYTNNLGDKKFDEKELVESICMNLFGENCVEFTTLRESFRNIIWFKGFTTILKNHGKIH